jgi:D-lactate dehydrogenase (cytochrome)
VQVKTAPDDIQDYVKDTSNMPGGHAERLVFPTSVEEIQAVLREANEARVPVTISGARTGTVGGAIPFGGWLLSLVRLNKVKSVDRESMTMAVEAGALLADVKNAADAQGLLYPPDPTEWSCQIGGTIATNASGARTFRYGATRAWVNALKIVLSDGELLELRRGDAFAKDGVVSVRTASGRTVGVNVPTFPRPEVTKNASGYYSADPLDAIDLFIGSEGTLGVVVEAELKLIPRSTGTFSGVVFFKKNEELLNFVDAARSASHLSRIAVERFLQAVSDPVFVVGEDRRSGVGACIPKGEAPSILRATLIEYFDRNSLRFIAERFPESPIDVAGAVYFEQETTAETEDSVFAAWNELLEKHNADLARSWFTTTDADREKMRAFRHALPLAANERYSRSGFKKVSTDMAVPMDRFRSLLKFYEDICGASGIDHVIFGHIGDCHLHLNLFPRSEDEATRARHIYGRCVAQAIMLGGVLSAEHGTGKLKRKYLAAMMGERYLNEMAAVKRAFDPNGILGRGNIFDESYLG